MNERPIIVQKYGGSSVADVVRIRRVATRVAASVAAGHRVVVVVSAMGNTTNELLALAREISPRPGRRELDLLVSVGERVSMTLLAMAIEELGLPAASFTGSQSGIITDEQHVAAQVIEVRPHRVQRALDEGKVAIVAGFQGVSRTGEVTTLGRGGSDTTAVVLAAALGARWCELCSDVDGVFSADPRVVPAARRLDVLPLDAAAALAQAGSRIIAADAVEMARRWGVVLVSSETARPAGSGTHLPPGPVPLAVVGVAGDDQVLWLPEARPEAIAEAEGAVLAWLPGLGVLVDGRNLHGSVQGREVARVSAVGRGLVASPLRVGRALEALPQRLGWWATGEVLSVIVERAVVGEAQRALYGAVMEG